MATKFSSFVHRGGGGGGGRGFVFGDTKTQIPSVTRMSGKISAATNFRCGQLRSVSVYCDLLIVLHRHRKAGVLSLMKN